MVTRLQSQGTAVTSGTPAVYQAAYDQVFRRR